MSGEKIQRYLPQFDVKAGQLKHLPDCGGPYVLHADHLAALASRDATIKTQGEEIANLRRAIESFLSVHAHNISGTSDGCGNGCVCGDCKFFRSALAPGAKSTGGAT